VVAVVEDEEAAAEEDVDIRPNSELGARKSELRKLCSEFVFLLLV
jgi:hypothetical protein